MKIIITSTFLIIGVCLQAFSQQDSVPLSAILTKTGKIATERPLERVYLHFDKPYYAVGDTIWFKAYVTTLENQPTTLSKIVYVDLVSPGDSLAATLKLPLMNGVSPGCIPLPEMGFKEGNYQIRAYTKWMLNFDDAYFFNKTVPIGNALNKQLKTFISFSNTGREKDDRADVEIQFKDEDGTPYANKKVTWNIKLGYDVVSKGKEVTDNNGYVSFSINKNDKQDLSKGELQTVLATDNSKSLAASFPLRTAFEKLDLQFFPEGGDLIEGIPSKIAFKAVQANGLGKDVQGQIVDNDGKVITEFKSQHLGMGVFTLFPEPGKTYKAAIANPDGSKSTFSLPAVRSEGIKLQVTGVDTSEVRIKIIANAAYFNKYKTKGLYVVGQSGTVIYYAAQTGLKAQVSAAAIPKNKFPPGILQLTLFTSAGKPVSERLVFIDPVNGINITANPDRPTYAKKQKVQLTVGAKINNLPVEGNFSIAVIDESKVPYDENKESTILTNLLLTSDLKGFVEKPNYYFNKMDDKKRSDLDVLMLTQGYRRFSYSEILADKYPPISFLPEQKIEVTGTLRSSNGMPLNKGGIRLSIPDLSFSKYAVTDPEGKFKFSDLVLADTSKAILESSIKNVMLMVDPNYFPAYSKTQHPDEILNIDSTLSTYLRNSKLQYRTAHVLQEVVVKDRPIAKPSHADYPALSGLSTPDHTVAGDAFKSCGDLLSCLKGSLPGLTYQNDNFYVARDYSMGNKTPVQIYLNGMAVDIAALTSVNPTQIESAEIFLKDELGMVNRATHTNGVLVINTKKAPKGMKISKDALQSLLPQPNVVTLPSIGYTMVRQFYAPKYAVASSTLTNDRRSTIYWNPMLLTDKNGKATLQYFNGDGKGTYRVIIEGFDATGHLGRTVVRYTVK